MTSSMVSDPRGGSPMRPGGAAILVWIAPRAFAVLCLFCCTQGPVFHLRFKLGFPEGFYLSDPVVVLGFTVLWAVAVAYAWSARDAILASRWAAYLPLLFSTYALVSTLWSEHQPRTLIYATLLCGTTMFALWFGTYFSTQAQIVMVFIAMQLGCVLSVIAVARESYLALDVLNRWTGIYINRNSLAPVAALGLGSTVALAVIVRQRWLFDLRSKVFLWIPLAGFAYIDVVLIRQSHSATSVGGLIAGSGAAALYAMWRLLLRRGGRGASSRSITLVHVSLGLGLVAAWSIRHRLVELASRDPTINGRTRIWGVVFDWIRERPLKGHGWMAAWGVPERQAVLSTPDNPTTPFAHNSFLEAALGLGWPGAILLASVAAFAFLVSSERLLRDDRWTDLWGLSSIVYAVFLSLFEGFFDANQVPWILAVAAGVSACSTHSGMRARTVGP